MASVRWMDEGCIETMLAIGYVPGYPVADAVHL